MARSKPRKVSKAKKKKALEADLIVTGPGEYKTPKEQYIFSYEKISIVDLAKQWKGHKGCAAVTLRDKCTREKWADLRDEHITKKMILQGQRLAEQEIDVVLDARKRHIKMAHKLRDVAQEALNENREVKFFCEHCDLENKIKIPIKDMMKPSDVVRWMKESVDIERKGLGISEAVAFSKTVKQVAMMYQAIVQKYVNDVQTYVAIRRDFLELRGKTFEEAIDFIKANYEIDPDFED